MRNLEHQSNGITPNLIRDGLYEMLCDLDNTEFTLFHMTLTYLPYQDRIYKESDLSKFFINYHLKTLLPKLFNTRTWTTTKKLKQPIVLAFLDEHKQSPVISNYSSDHQPIYSYPINLHHHCIVASRSFTTEFYQDHIGTNTLLKYSPKFMTTDLKSCDPDRVYYASKMLWKHPDYLIFGKQ